MTAADDKECYHPLDFLGKIRLDISYESFADQTVNIFSVMLG